jgi:hypothetical protein
MLVISRGLDIGKYLNLRGKKYDKVKSSDGSNWLYDEYK